MGPCFWKLPCVTRRATPDLRASFCRSASSGSEPAWSWSYSACLGCQGSGITRASQGLPGPLRDYQGLSGITRALIKDYVYKIEDSQARLRMDISVCDACLVWPLRIPCMRSMCFGFTRNIDSTSYKPWCMLLATSTYTLVSLPKETYLHTPNQSKNPGSSCQHQHDHDELCAKLLTVVLVAL